MKKHSQALVFWQKVARGFVVRMRFRSIKAKAQGYRRSVALLLDHVHVGLEECGVVLMTGIWFSCVWKG